MYSEKHLQDLQLFYETLSATTGPLEQKHAACLQCKKGCFSCCEDDLEIFGIEAENIRKNFTDFLATAHAHPEGKCAFLDAEGACRIYAARPYVCRTQGLPLMIHLEEDGRELELIDICELNEPTLSLDELADEDFFFTNPWEEKLAILQMQADKGKMDRMKLRDLFEPSRRHGL
jgi:Fe-S-cluster containining protein